MSPLVPHFYCSRKNFSIISPQKSLVHVGSISQKQAMLFPMGFPPHLLCSFRSFRSFLFQGPKARELQPFAELRIGRLQVCPAGSFQGHHHRARLHVAAGDRFQLRGAFLQKFLQPFLVETSRSHSTLPGKWWSHPREFLASRVCCCLCR